MTTQCGFRYIDAQQCRGEDKDDIYIVQPHRIGWDNTFFQTLFPAAWNAEVRVAGTPTPDDSIAQNVIAPLRVPSLSASERIRGWDTGAAHPVNSDAHLNDSTAHVDASGMELLSDYDREEFHRSTGFRETELEDPTHNVGASVSQPPFHVRVREVEKRFREQMEVHRGLTTAARQLQLTQKSVHTLRAERRTRAVMQAIHERQETIWKQVWPSDNVPPVFAEDAEKVSVSAFAISPKQTIRSSAPHVAVKATATLPANAAAITTPETPTSPASAASPTSDLLKDILKTFSKPRELRGDGSSTGRSVATPIVPAAKISQDRSRSSGLVTATSVAHEKEEAFPGAPRFTASGVEIVPPPFRPVPYAVVRYIEVPRSDTSSTPKHSIADVPSADRQLLKSTATAHSPSISEEYSQEIGSRSDSISTDNFGRGDSRIDSEVGVRASDASERKSLTKDDDNVDGYRSDSFEVEDETETLNGSAHKAPVLSDISSVPHSAHYSSSFTDSIADVDESDPEDLAESTVVTSSVRSTKFDTGSDTGKLRQGRPCRGPSGAKSPRYQRHKTTKRAATVDEVVERFLAACEAVSSTAQQLLQSPFVRKHGKIGTVLNGRKPSLPSTSQTRSPLAQSSLRGAGSVKSSNSNSSNNNNSISTPTETCVSQGAGSALLNAATAVSNPSQDWRENLEKQLRNVRHLRRFRDHLLRHLDLVERHRTAQREKRQLLRQTQAIAKVRQTVLRQSPGGGDIDVYKLLKGAAGVRRTTGRGANQRQRERRPRSAEDEDEIVDEIATEITHESIISDDVSSAIEEDVPNEYSVSDEIEGAVSESIEEYVEDQWGNSAVGSAVLSESNVPIEDEVFDGDNDNNYSDGFSTISEETFSADAADGDDQRLGFLGVAGEGLDEIEEELADRLAELSSTVLSESSSVPSDVEELIDLLPSSLIPSEIEDEDGIDSGARRKYGSSTVSTESDTAIETDSSVETLRDQQRRTYVAVKGNLNVVGSGGKNNKAYIQESISSSVFTAVSSDADVDTTVKSSETVVEEIGDASTVVASPSRENQQHPTASEAAVATAFVAGDLACTSEDESSTKTESDSTDALTALEVDMALTKKRRQAALRSAVTVPLFSELYNPLARAARHDAVAQEKNVTFKEDKLQSSTDVHGDVEARTTAQFTVAPEADHHSAEEAAVKFTWENAPYARLEAETQTEVPVSAEPVATASVSTTAHPNAPTSLSKPSRRTYAKEDLVAQSAWKARQLNVLRELRSISVVEALRQEMVNNDGKADEGVNRSNYTPALPRSSVELAMDVAEDAAREEFAQHWGVLESLLQTRFASPRFEEGMTLSSSPSGARLRKVHKSRGSVPRAGTSSVNDASRSSWSASSSALFVL